MRQKDPVSHSAAAWDAEYRNRGQLWGGAPAALPLLPGPGRILEIGCGTGKTLAALRNPEGDVIATDISCRALELCREQNRGICPVLSDGGYLPFRDESFAAVLAVHVLGHVPAHGRLMMAAELFRVLLPGGLLVFRAFSNEDMRFGRGERVESGTFQRGNGIITHYFSVEEVRNLFASFPDPRIRVERRFMRVRGRDLLRSEILVECTKP